MVSHPIIPMARYIDKIGIELELGIDREDGDSPSVPKFRITHDGSINCSGIDCDTNREYVSVPCDYKADWMNDDMNELDSAITRLYNDHNAQTNSSMGMHLHMSFYKDYYRYAIASEDFIEYFEEEIKESDLYSEYQLLRERLRGNNSYAKKVREDDLQRAINRGGASGSSRYRHFIYRSGTVEFRIMPGLDSAKDVRRAVDLLTSIVNSYLYNKRHEFEESDSIETEVVEPKIPDKEDLEKEDLQEVIEYV